MSNDLHLSSNSEDIQYQTMDPENPKKKSGGCGCFIVGCLVVIALVLLPLIGGSLYLGSLDDEEWGGFIISMATNQSIINTLKEEINRSQDLDAQRKKELIEAYDTFLKRYGALSADEQKLIKKDVYVVVKTLLSGHHTFEENTPPEFTKILTMLGLETQKMDVEPSPSEPKTKTPSTVPSTPTAPTEDDYDF